MRAETSKLKDKESKSKAAAEEKKSADGAVSNVTLKKHVEKIQSLKKKAADANADVRAAFNAAVKDGLDKAALKDVLAIITANTNTDDHKATVNIYMEMLGKPPLFAFADNITKH